MGGECGECLNFIKKMRRGEKIPIESVAFELADIIIYADLLAARLNIELDKYIVKKFNKVSKKKRCNIYL